MPRLPIEGPAVRLLLAAAWMLVIAVPRLPGASADAERKGLESDLHALEARLARLRSAKPAGGYELTDAEVYAKGVAWALRYEPSLRAADVALIRKALARGDARAAALEAGRQPWARATGQLVRAYRSAVDGSVQPYGLIVPAGYDPGRPIRLDVVLHGSTRPVGLSELRFMDRFDEGGPPAPAQPFIELHPLGRVENCYRWAGETDVFEAIESVCRRYRIDRDRIVLRGMSMGASGTWHLGLKHPDYFVALGPYCGYVDTHRFSETPLPNFVKVGPLPPHQEVGLHMLDSIDYAANAGVVPVVACMGEKDVFFQAHVLMADAMRREGLELVNLISPGTGHVIDPVTHREQMRRLGEFAGKGLDHRPRHLRFVTWTLKYGRCHWLLLLGLEHHYARAEVEARLADDGSVRLAEPKNVTRLAILPGAFRGAAGQVRVGETAVAVPMPRRGAVLEKSAGTWRYVGTPDAVRLAGKRPGLQGPIDDAFTSPFLCVRGTGRPWNPAVGAWADASLRRFAAEWARYFRGELPLKDDTAVTEQDLRERNVVLFGDPGSNQWVRRVLPSLPIQWSRDELRMAGGAYAADRHAPVLIQPNPLPGAAGRYVVLNSGHTFHEAELASLNYLLFPRLGDWAVVRVPERSQGLAGEQVLRAGFCDEGWGLPAGKR